MRRGLPAGAEQAGLTCRSLASRPFCRTALRSRRPRSARSSPTIHRSGERRTSTSSSRLTRPRASIWRGRRPTSATSRAVPPSTLHQRRPSQALQSAGSQWLGHRRRRGRRWRRGSARSSARTHRWQLPCDRSASPSPRRFSVSGLASSTPCWRRRSSWARRLSLIAYCFRAASARSFPLPSDCPRARVLCSPRSRDFTRSRSLLAPQRAQRFDRAPSRRLLRSSTLQTASVPTSSRHARASPVERPPERLSIRAQSASAPERVARPFSLCRTVMSEERPSSLGAKRAHATLELECDSLDELSSGDEAIRVVKRSRPERPRLPELDVKPAADTVTEDQYLAPSMPPASEVNARRAFPRLGPPGPQPGRGVRCKVVDPATGRKCGATASTIEAVRPGSRARCSVAART